MNQHLKALLVVGVVVALAGGGWAWWESSRQKPSPVRERVVASLPAFQAVTLEGKAISEKDYLGKLVIVNFWASWCGPCVEEIPSFLRLKEAMGDDVQILAISNDSTLEDIEIFLKSFPRFKAPLVEIVHDAPPTLTVTKLFDVFRLPESYVFDRSGRMVRKVVGTIDWSSEDAMGYLRMLANQRPESND